MNQKKENKNNHLSSRNPINISTLVNILTIACRVPFGILCNLNRPHRLRNGFNLMNENEKNVCWSIKKRRKKNNFLALGNRYKSRNNNSNIIMNAIYVMAESSFEMRKRKSKREEKTPSLLVRCTFKEKPMSQWLHLFNFIRLIIMKQVKKTPELFIFLTDSLVSPIWRSHIRIICGRLSDVCFQENS